MNYIIAFSSNLQKYIKLLSTSIAIAISYHMPLISNQRTCYYSRCTQINVCLTRRTGYGSTSSRPSDAVRTIAEWDTYSSCIAALRIYSTFLYFNLPSGRNAHLFHHIFDYYFLHKFVLSLFSAPRINRNNIGSAGIISFGQQKKKQKK